MNKEEKNMMILSKQIDVMKAVLRRTEFTDKQDVPNQKGKIASYIFGTEELILTEVLFSGTFKNLSAKQLVTILSLFINEERLK